MLVPSRREAGRPCDTTGTDRGRPPRSSAIAGQGGPMLIAGRPLTLLLLALGSPAAPAQPPGLAGPAAPAPAAGRRPTTSRGGMTAPRRARRWRPSTSPSPATTARPGLIANAIDCLDLERPRPRDARARRGAAGPPARVHPQPPGHPALRRPRPPRGGPRGAGRGGRAADRPGPPGRRPAGGSTPRPSGGSGGCGSSPPAASARPRRRAPGWPRAGPTRRRRCARSRGPRWAGATSPWPRGASTSATSRPSSAPRRGRRWRGSWPS